MSECCNGNDEKVLNILMGYAQCQTSLMRSLWWITRYLTNSENKILIVDDGNCGNVKSALDAYLARSLYQIIKIDNKKLKDIFGIDSLNESKNLGYAICNKLSTSRKKVQISPRSICYSYNFSDFVKNINENNVVKMNTYLIPKYVQPALGKEATNFCNILAAECRKYPLNTETFPPFTEDYITKAYLDNSNKEEKFLEYECFYLEPEEEIKSDKINAIDENLIDKLLE